MQPDHIPAFELQPEFIAAGASVTRIDNEKLSGVPTGARFNGSIVEWRGRRLMAYRQYNPKRKMRSVPWDAKQRGETTAPQARDIAISWLGPNWQPTGEHITVHFPLRHGDECYEDPRLFVFQDALWLGCAELDLYGHGWCVNQRLFRLHPETLQIEHAVNINLGQNFGHKHSCEKNWTYFPVGTYYLKDTTESDETPKSGFTESQKLILLYNVCEMQTHQINPKTGQVLAAWIDRKLFWPYGHMRGGTCPLPLGDGTFLKFTHNSTDHEWRAEGGTRRYSMSAVIFSGRPPFKILKVSRLPIVWGSRHEAYCGHGNSQCVFPAGVIIENSVWHVSAGINDTYNAIFHLDPDRVMAGMVDAEQFHEPQLRYFWTPQPNTVASIVGRERLWELTKSGATAQEGVLATQDPFTIAELIASATAKEITEAEYQRAIEAVRAPKQATPDKAPPINFGNPVNTKPYKTDKDMEPTAAVTKPVESDAKPKNIIPPQTGYGLYDGIAHYIPRMDGWSSVEKCQRLAGDVLGTDAQISVDLGAYSGRAALSMAMAHRQAGHGVCHAIDSWSHEVALRDMKGDDNRRWWAKPGTPGKIGTLDLEAIYRGFIADIAAHNLQKYITVHRLESDDAVKLFEDGSVSVLHFDANHSEEASLNDIGKWMPKMKAGGYIYFDDTDWAEDGKNTTGAAQKALLDAGYELVHTEPPVKGQTGEWKIFQKPRGPLMMTHSSNENVESTPESPLTCGQCEPGTCECQPAAITVEGDLTPAEQTIETTTP